MSNRWFVVVYVAAAVSLGWFWRIGYEQRWLVEPLGYGLFMALSVWLWSRLDRSGRR